MKKTVIGLALLTSASVFANCEKGTVECYLGTYTGVELQGYYAYETDSKCQIEITKSGSDKDVIRFKYFDINGKVSIKTQQFENYTEIHSDGSAMPRNYISRLRLKKDLPEDSKRKSYTLDLQLDENLVLVGTTVTVRTYRPLDLNVIFGIYDAWQSPSFSCAKLVKIK